MTNKQTIEMVSLKKRKHIIYLYLEGMSCDEIACGASVTKATVGYIILKLRTGQYPEFTGLSEQIEILRKLTLKLRRLRLEPEQISKEGRW